MMKSTLLNFCLILFVLSFQLFFHVGESTINANNNNSAETDIVTVDLAALNRQKVGSFSYPHRHYSGYLESINGIRLHYWYFESQSNTPEKDPFALWLNGGPGCSSLLGALSELGPIRLYRNGSLGVNPYAWNQHVNLLFLESPVGVGFSYREDDGQSNITLNDNTTAEINFAALKSFYQKFPHLTDNQFYILGESYAGIYIPTLSMLVLEHKFPKNFKG